MTKRYTFLPLAAAAVLVLIDYLWIRSIFADVHADCLDWHLEDRYNLPAMFSKGLMLLGAVGAIVATAGASFIGLRATDVSEERRQLRVLLRVSAVAFLLVLVGAFFIELHFIPPFDDSCVA